MGIKFTKLESIYNNMFLEKKEENINSDQDTITIYCGDVPLVINKNTLIYKTNKN